MSGIFFLKKTLQRKKRRDSKNKVTKTCRKEKKFNIHQQGNWKNDIF